MSNQVHTPGRWFRFNIWLHRWTSLIATIPFLILCITGTILIFHEEIEAALGEVPVSQHAADTPQRPASESIANVLAAYPDERVLSTGLDPEHHPGVMLVVTGPKEAKSFEGAKVRFTDLVTAQPVGDPDPGMTFTGFLLELHAEWFLGPIGELIGALIALLVFLSLVSGIVVYAPYVRRMAFGVLRRGKGRAAAAAGPAQFHGCGGTGLGPGGDGDGFPAGLQLGGDRCLADDRAGPSARGGQPHGTGGRASSAGGRGPRLCHRPGGGARGLDGEHHGLPADRILHAAPLHRVAGGQSGAWDERLFRVVIVDAKTGEVPIIPEVPGYIKAISLSQPLHFGDYGGLPLKLLWTACTWLTLFITANGAWLWWDRRRKRQAVPAGVAA